MNADIRKAHKRYVKAVRKRTTATLAQWEQQDVVDGAQAELSRRKDAVRDLSAEVERRRDALVEAVGRAS